MTPRQSTLTVTVTPGTDGVAVALGVGGFDMTATVEMVLAATQYDEGVWRVHTDPVKAHPLESALKRLPFVVKVVITGHADLADADPEQMLKDDHVFDNLDGVPADDGSEDRG